MLIRNRGYDGYTLHNITKPYSPPYGGSPSRDRQASQPLLPSNGVCSVKLPIQPLLTSAISPESKRERMMYMTGEHEDNKWDRITYQHKIYGRRWKLKGGRHIAITASRKCCVRLCTTAVSRQCCVHGPGRSTSVWCKDSGLGLAGGTDVLAVLGRLLGCDASSHLLLTVTELFIAQ